MVPPGTVLAVIPNVPVQPESAGNALLRRRDTALRYPGILQRLNHVALQERREFFVGDVNHFALIRSGLAIQCEHAPAIETLRDLVPFPPEVQFPIGEDHLLHHNVVLQRRHDGDRPGGRGPTGGEQQQAEQ